MRSVLLLIVVASLVVASMALPAGAIAPFYMEFKKEYLDTHSDKEYAAAVNKSNVRCLVCHQGKQRKHHNPFGEHLVELLDRKKDIRDKEKIRAEIKKVLEMHVDPKDDKSETYLDRVKASKWPGGELDDLKKEPPEQQAAQ